ncbi:helix-turn-helix domain-containing protein [Streptomyces microflavus]|uniref:helix-turn-helix domain-containing protein n=1 Tax=Streptomyces microflavus TaxID=1919 RepID=UPI00365644B6
MTPHALMIRNTRKLRGWSQQTLADAAGVTAATISRVERGLTGASDEVLRRVACALGVGYDDVCRTPQTLAKAAAAPRVVPAPTSPEAEFFYYTPEEAAEFLPVTYWWLKREVTKRAIPFTKARGRILFTAPQVLTIRAMFDVRPLAESEPVQRRSA